MRRNKVLITSMQPSRFRHVLICKVRASWLCSPSWPLVMGLHPTSYQVALSTHSLQKQKLVFFMSFLLPLSLSLFAFFCSPASGR